MLELPDPESTEGVSDWIELQLSLSNERVQRGLVSASIRGAVGDEPTDDFLGGVWLEMQMREQLYKPSPFVVEDFAVEPRVLSKSTKLAYQICLVLTLYGATDKTRTVQDLFERITNEAIKTFFSAESVVFGYRGSKIGERTINLAEELKEKFIEEPDRRFKDRGLDIVTWKSFPDERSGKLVLLTQCASGHDWKGKSPIPLRPWEQYIHWAIRPTIAFSVPCIISQREWHDHSSEKGMLIDRLRLMNELHHTFNDSELENDMEKWIEAWKQSQGIDE